MIYEIRKDGYVCFHTEHESCRPGAKREAELQKYGYEIYIDGKKQRRVKA